jgi:hypothetical protein
MTTATATATAMAMATAKLKDIAEIKSVLARHRADLAAGYKIKEIGVFGSYVRGEADDESDLDLLVEFCEPVGFIDFIRAENYLSDLLGIKVDLVLKDSLKPRIGKCILEEVSRI